MPPPTTLLRAHDYTASELAHLQPPTKHIFAIPPNPAPNSAIAQLHKIAPLPPLRTSATLSSFNIYPSASTSLPINNLIWTTVNTGTYNPQIGDPLLGAHVFILGLTPELHEFLSSVSLEEMQTAIIDFLVLLHHQLQGDNDEDGIAKMAEDLVPEVWRRVEKNIGVFPNGEPETGRRARTLEQLVQISFMTPWRVDIFGAFLTADDVSMLSFEGELEGGSRGMGVGAVMSKLYDDWKLFNAVLCGGLALPPGQAAEAMERAIHAGKGGGLMEQAMEVVEGGKRVGCWFELLPAELIQGRLVGWIVKRGCEMIRPRRRRLASLKSLLEMSSKYLEELREGALDEELEGVDVWNGNGLGVVAVGTGGVSTGDRVGVGVGVSRVLGEVGLSVEQVTEEIVVGVEESVMVEAEERYSVEGNVVYPLDEVNWEGGEGREWWVGVSGEIGNSNGNGSRTWSSSSSGGSSVVAGACSADEDALVEEVDSERIGGC